MSPIQGRMKQRSVQVQVGGDSYGHLEHYTAAEVQVLEVLWLGARMRLQIRTSNLTRANPKQPWNLSAHSRTVHRLEERKAVETLLVSVGDRWETRARLTKHGREAVAAIRALIKVIG